MREQNSATTIEISSNTMVDRVALAGGNNTTRFYCPLRSKRHHCHFERMACQRPRTSHRSDNALAEDMPMLTCCDERHHQIKKEINSLRGCTVPRWTIQCKCSTLHEAQKQNFPTTAMNPELFKHDCFCFQVIRLLTYIVQNHYFLGFSASSATELKPKLSQTMCCEKLCWTFSVLSKVLGRCRRCRGLFCPFSVLGPLRASVVEFLRIIATLPPNLSPGRFLRPLSSYHGLGPELTLSEKQELP